MLRFCIVEEEKPLQEMRSDIPQPPPKGLIVKIKKSGVCHSDLNQWFNKINTGFGQRKFTDNPNYKFPICPGHEISGVVESLGKDVGPNDCRLSIGDRVIVYPWISCENCLFCDYDERPLCSKRYFGLGIGASGGYSTHVSVCHTKFALKVPATLPLEVACMLPCSGLTTFNAIENLQPTIVKKNKQKGSASVLIVGAGGLGLWCVQLARHILPPTTKIVVADISERSLEQARQRGCDDVVLLTREQSKDEAIAEIKSKAIDGAFDGIIDLVGNPITAERHFGSTHRGGHIVMVGLYGGAASFPLIDFVHGLRTVQGSLTGSLQQLEDLLELAGRKSLIPPPTTCVPLEKAYEAMCELRDGKVVGRFVLDC